MSTRFVCLMYHEVLESRPQTGAGDFFAVSRDDFARQLDAIAAAGLRGCSLEEALASRDGRDVAITFDDGSAGEYELAVPELVSRNMHATFFVTTNWIGTPGFVTWEQLRAMQAAGMEVGSHTRSHPFLSELGEADLADELVTSRQEIERELGRRITSLALPGGDAPSGRHRDALSKAGYSVVATSRWGTNAIGSSATPRYIRRCTVHGRLTADEFQQVMLGNPFLSFRRRSREWILATARRTIGPTRYARWRRGFLERS